MSMFCPVMEKSKRGMKGVTSGSTYLGIDAYACCIGWRGRVQTSLIIFLCVGSLWLPVLVLQKRLQQMASSAVEAGKALDDEYHGVYRKWFWLGIFGFLGMFVIVMIMVTKMTPRQLTGLWI